MAFFPTTPNGVISTVNSTVANLAGAAVFTGTAENVTEYATIVVSVFSSHASATDGLSIQQSSDGTNWDLTDVFSIPAATGKTFSVPVQAEFYRLGFTNGATLTTSLRIETIFSKGAKKGSSVRPQDARTNDNDFEENLSYLMGYNGTTWDRLRSSVASGLVVSGVDTTATGSITAISQNVALALNGKSGVAIQITGTWVGTLQFEGTVDGTNWVTANGVFAGSSTPGPTITTNGIVRVTPSGLAQFRITSTAWTSGTAVITIRASDATGGTFLNQSLTAGTNAIGKVHPQHPARVVRNFLFDTFTAAPVADTMQSVTQWYNNAAVATTVSPAVVPAGKILRLTSWGIETKSLATVGSVVLRLRANTAGTAVIGSPLVTSLAAGSQSGSTTIAMTGGFSQGVQDFGEDGLEFTAGTGIGFSLAGYGPAGVLTLQGVTRFWATGFEYTA